MRIKSIYMKDIPPVERFEVENLSDLVVISGPNGVGKSRLISGLLAEFQRSRGHASKGHFILEATSDDEQAKWGKRLLNTSVPADLILLTTTLQQNRQRRNFKSSILYYESNRLIQNLQPLNFTWELVDPWEENVAWNSTFGGLSNRFQDTIHALFKKVQTQKSAIATSAIRLKREGRTSMNLDFIDALDPFKEVFHKLLGPKALETIDPQSQRLRYSGKGATLDAETLSSGEREVLNIAFDFQLRIPSDCIVFFDEPELHLHPELTFKLISTLRGIGERNQFILCSHSPDLISGSLNDSVIFLTPPRNGANQAIIVDSTNETSSLLNKLGQSIGIIALGKKIVLVEGDDNSLDKKTYAQLTRGRFPNLVILPSKGKEQVATFGNAVSTLLSRTLWGVDFYMLCDRDAVPFGSATETRLRHHNKVRLLSRYHLENYFLDTELMAAAFETMEASDSWLRNKDAIEKKLLLLATDSLSYATALVVSRQLRLNAGNIDVMPGACTALSLDELTAKISGTAKSESSRIHTELEVGRIEELTKEVYTKLSESIGDGTWRTFIPGKQIVSRFCAAANITVGRYINLYLAESEKNNHAAFKEVLDVFQAFSEA